MEISSKTIDEIDEEREKEDLKNEYSRRQIQLRPAMKDVLERQWEQTRHFDSPYVFLTPIGTPMIQDRLREHWKRAMDESKRDIGACMKRAKRSHPGP